MKQDLVTEGLPCLKQKNMHQTAMAQGVCTASSKAVVAAAAPATAALAVRQSAAEHHENAAKARPQIQLVIQQEVLLGPLLPQRKVRTHT